ncbi:hypothetical protein Forpe1208_v015788 [Fusarium oxysporum f. sp. rapae]|uniref:Peptidase C14 caspase domain-containing protein n=1 Tax=Fusarium oxysporum f. sp. rapae TaxID=485398 RepID=A0A8J5NHN0_FUSOX|nr:hypothetical protein Forpe1208_v015788 [Fusarium oxysporum f. sp. rapae]
MQLMGSVKIQSLVARRDPTTNRDAGEQTSELGPNWPTCRNVISALKTITATAKTGDYIYVHYSGHGSRMKPVFNMSNRTTGDLALVLLEGHQSSDRYLRGPKLAGLLNAMVEKGLVVTVVLDCCFSASVYRNSDNDDNVRFLPDESEVGTYPEDITKGDNGYRDGSMRDNWLIDPDRYTILTACGPHEIATNGFHVEDRGKLYGALSYFLSKALSDHGLNRRHKDIYSHICSVFEYHCVPQTPVLYGNGNQGFFGMVKQQGKARQVCVMKRGAIVRLLSGLAHGVCEKDRFSIAPSNKLDDGTVDRDNGDLIGEVTQVQPLTCEMRVLGDSTDIQTGWVAEPLTSSYMSKCMFRLDPGLPCYDALLDALQRKSFGRHVSLEQDPAAQVTRVTSGANAYQVLDDSLEDILHIPSIPYGEEKTVVESICGILEHLTRFRMVKDLSNKSPTDAFRQHVQVQMVMGEDRFEPNGHIQALHERPIEIIVRNQGTMSIYAHFYNLGPCGRVKGMLGGTFVEIPPKYDPDDPREIPCTGTWKKRIKMKIPPVLQARGFCNDIMKVLITSKATSFETYELPDFNQIGKQESAQRQSGSQVDSVEEWMAFNFYIRTIKPL